MAEDQTIKKLKSRVFEGVFPVEKSEISSGVEVAKIQGVDFNRLLIPYINQKIRIIIEKVEEE